MKYTGRMLWKFKKTSHATPSAIAPSASVGHDSQSVPTETTVVATEVENVDRAPSYPQGAFVIPRGYRISGTIVTSRPVVVEGELEGTALVAPTVHVGKSGRLNIPTQAAIVTVSGSVEGPVSARDYVEVQKGGTITSEVDAGGITILPGGLVSGARLAVGPLRSLPSH